MKYHFYNAQILSNGEFINGDVLVEEEKIVYVGSNPPETFKADRKINVKNNILMSGFVNCHTHTPSTILRGFSDDLALDEWLKKIIPYERYLDDDDIYWATLLGVLEYVKAGITSVEENYSHIKPILRAYQSAGFRARIGIGFPDVNKIPEISIEEQFNLCEKFEFPSVCYAHSIYGTSDESFDKIIAFAKKNNLPVSTHMSETLKEVGDCSAKFDKTPVELLEHYGFFDRPATVYHCVHADKDDLSILASYGVNVVTCPSSNLKLASGIAPIFAMQNAGILIGIGTDGVYSNNAFDMFKEMFLVATLNKAYLYNASVIKAEEVVQMATKNGAKILGLEKVGDIVEGNFADLILVDITGPHHYPHHNLISNLVYSAKSSDVYLTMINGKIVYENGVFNIGTKPDEIFKQVIKIKEKISKLLEK